MPDRIHFPKIASFLNITFEQLLELIEAPQTLEISLKIENKTLTPNKKHLSILNRGVKAWNRWRIKNPDVIPDLAGANSVPHELSGINLTKANLKGSTLYKVNLKEADLSSVDFSSADLTLADLRNANLNRANLEYAKIVSSYIYGVSIWDIKLKGAVQKNLNICPWKTSYICVNDIRAAYIKSLQIANSEDSKILIITQDFQAALESQNKSSQEQIN